MSGFEIEGAPTKAVPLVFAPVLVAVVLVVVWVGASILRGTSEIVVPKADIPAYQRLTDDRLVTRRTREDLAAGTARAKADLIGRVTREAVAANQAIGKDSITAKSVNLAAYHGPTLTLPAARSSAVAVKPGDPVTVLLTPKAGSAGLRSAQVRAVLLNTITSGSTNEYVVRLASAADTQSAMDLLGRSEIHLVAR